MTSLTVMVNTWKPKKVSVSGSTKCMKFLDCNTEFNITVCVPAGAANGANGANNNVKAAAIPPASPAVTPNSSSTSSVKTVPLPATPVKVIHLYWGSLAQLE